MAGFLLFASLMANAQTTCPTPAKKYSLDTIGSVAQYTEVVSSRKLADEHYCYTIIANVNVVDVEQGITLAGRYVVLDHDRIRKITDNKDSIPKFPKNKCVLYVEGSGKYLSPGLCDMHVHYGCMAGERFAYLLNGVTTVRNAGGTQFHREEQLLLERNRLLGPDLLTTTTAITKYNYPKLDSLMTVPGWIYFNYNSVEKIDSVLMRIAGTNCKISVDLIGTHPKTGFPNGTVFERTSESTELLLQRNDPGFWYISRFYHPNTDLVTSIQPGFADQVKQRISQFCIGSETGSENVRYGQPGELVLHEMRFLEEAGVARADVIRVATLNAGRMGQNFSPVPFGLIKEGYRANLILLSGDPFQDLGNFKKITGLFSRGSWISGADMVEMRKFLHLPEWNR